MMDVAILKKKAESQGWRVDVTSNGHLRFFPPEDLGGGYVPSVGLHSRDWRAIKNTVAHLKRRGLRMDRQKKAAPGEALYLCVDCGFSHPYEEMMLVPRRGGDAVDPRPTRYCKPHFQQRKTAGRHEQIERDRQAKAAGVLGGTTSTLAVTPPPAAAPNGDTPAQLGGEGSDEGTPDPPVMGTRQTDGPDGDSGPSPVMGQPASAEKPLHPGTMRALEATMQDLTEALLGGLADLERRVDSRLSTIEQIQTELRTAEAAARAKEPGTDEPAPAPSPEVVAALVHFSQQLLWLAQFDEGILPLDRKQEIARGEAAKLATRLW